MNQIKIDLKKGTIFIPKETAEAIGSPSEVSFLYKGEDASLYLVASTLNLDHEKKRRGRPANPQNSSFMKSWDQQANGYRIKGYMPGLSRLSWHFPGSERNSHHGIYILEGEQLSGNRIRYDLSTARLVEADGSDIPVVDLSHYQVVEHSKFARKPRFPAAGATETCNQQSRHDDIRN